MLDTCWRVRNGRLLSGGLHTSCERTNLIDADFFHSQKHSPAWSRPDAERRYMTDSRQGLLWARRIPRRSLCTALGCFQLGLSEVFKIDRCKNGESVVDEHVDRPIVDAVLVCH